MTDEMAIQQQRPSAMPYVLGGAAVGGAGGAALAKWTPYGITEVKYKSWDDVVNDVNKDDSFIKEQLTKDSDKKDKIQELKNKGDEIANVDKNINALNIDKDVKPNDFKDVIEKENALTNAEKELKTAALNAERERIVKSGTGYVIDESKIPAEFKRPDGWPSAVEEGGGKKIKLSTEQAKTLFEATDDSSKNLTNSLLENHGEIKNLVDGKVEGNVTQEMVDKLKDKRQAVTDAQTAVSNAENALSEKAKKVGKDARKQFVELSQKRGALVDNADKDLLKVFKKPSMLKTGLAAAAVLGLAGWLLAPKGDNYEA